MLQPAIGNVAEGEAFYDRKSELTLAWKRLENDNLLILAPRRIGKTSFMRRLVHTAAEHDYPQAVEISFAGLNDELGCLTAIADAIYNKLTKKGQIRRKFKTQLETLNGLKLSTTGISYNKTDISNANWRKVGDHIVDSFQALEGRSLICVDEIPVFVVQKILDKGSAAGVERSRDFLNWLRTLRQSHSKVRWVFAGSIGLDSIAQRFNMSDTINDLHLFKLGAFKPHVAKQFIAELAKAHDITVDEKTSAAILSNINWPLPYYLQIMVSQLQERQLLNDEQPSPAVVDNIIEELLSPAHNTYFDYWRQRLTDELGLPEATYAIDLLNIIAQSSTGSQQSTLMNTLTQRIQNEEKANETLTYLLAVLSRDSYIVNTQPATEDACWTFQFSLLRLWWQRR